MPIGKNALKRVSNNGYSKVSSSAPDMENSVIAETVERAASPTPVQKKTDEKTKKPASEKKAPSSAAKKANGKTVKPSEKSHSEKKNTGDGTDSGRDGFEYINIGGEMPIHLL